jgi:hypothetical protein
MFMSNRPLVAIALCVVAVTAVMAQRQWQTGTWREAKVERPRVLFSVESRDPNSNLPRTAPAREVRTYVIETDVVRLELRQDATVDTPRVDVLLGQPVTFALEKKIVYVRDEEGKEHKLSVRKVTKLTR